MSRQLRPRRRQRGMSLIEVMVALGVLAIAGAGTVATMTQLMNVNRQAAKRTVSAEMAREIIDTILGASYVTYDAAQFWDVLNNPPSPFPAMGCAVASPGNGTTPCEDEVDGIKRRIWINESGNGTVRVVIALGWKLRAAADDRFWTQYDMEVVLPL